MSKEHNIEWKKRWLRQKVEEKNVNWDKTSIAKTSNIKKYDGDKMSKNNKWNNIKWK
jgi:hypothetical protein